MISENKFDSNNELIPKEFANQIFQFCVCHNYLDAETGLQYDEKGEECDFMSFMILSEIHQNDRDTLSQSDCMILLMTSTFYQSQILTFGLTISLLKSSMPSFLV